MQWTADKPTWLFLDFDNTLMGTEAYALLSLIARFNKLYGETIAQPLTLETFLANFHTQARELLCKNLGKFYGIEVDYPTLYDQREKCVMQHYQEIPGGLPMAPNLVATLTDLSRDGVKLAFVSNNPVQRGLAAMRYASCGRGDELARLFGSNFFEAGEVQKPKPDVYLHAIAQVGADPAASFAVEDSATGSQAAIGARLTTFGYTGFSDKPEALAAKLRAAGCAATFNDWATFPALLKQQKSARSAA